MTDPSQLSDAELFAIAGIQPPAAPAPAAPAAPRQQPRAYTGQLPTDPEAVFGALVMQESGGRAGVLGPETQWGRAQGRTQMLPATAQEMAQRLGVPWRPELMTGTSPEAAAYQDRLGLEYLRQGYEQTGNMRDALRYYHGGPDRALWGPKTNAYAEEVLNRFAGGDAAPYRVVREQDLAPEDTPESLRAQGYEQDPNTGRWFRYVGQEQAPDLTAMSDAELMAMAGVEAPAQEPDTRTEGHRLALEQERANQEALNGLGRPAFADQATAPINDELEWLAGYLRQGIGNLGRSLTGQDIEVSALDRARASRDVAREAQGAFEREHPGQALAGGVLGGFAFAPTRAAAVPGLLTRLGQAGGVSAAYGVAEGDGVAGRLGSGALSGALGVATAGALEGLAPAARGVLRQVERARTPDLPARPEARVGSALERALERDGVTSAQVLDNMANAAPGRLPFEAGGENLVGLAETMAQAPGRARVAITDAVRTRQDDATNRVADRVGEAFGADGDFFVTLRDRIAARSQAAREGMAQIGERPITLTDDAVQAVRSDRAASAIREAAANRLASTDPAEREAGARLNRLVETALDNPSAAQMSVRDVQEVSYALNEAASSAFASGDGARGRALSDLGRAIRNAGREADPDYAAWLGQYGDASEAIDALRVGRNVMARASEKNAMSAPELRSRWAEWSDTAKENYRLGVGEALLDRVRGQGGVPALRRLLKDRELSDRVRIAFGSDDAFVRFMQSADDEVAMQGVANQVLGNSATARRQAGRADLEAQGFDPLDMVEAAADFTSPIGLGRQALRAAAKNLPRRDRSILGDEELNGLLGRVLTDPEAMTALLNRLQAARDMNARVAGRARALGLLSTPAVAGAGQERSRGLLTATP